MKKILSAVLVVGFLSSPAFAAEQNAPAPSAQDSAAKDKAAKDKASISEQREKQFLEETHARPAKKKAKKGAKKSESKADTSGSSAAPK